MAKISKLGRGLDVLLAHNKHREQPQQGDTLTSISVDQLQRGKFQPRDEIKLEALQELAKSIKSQGVIQPLVVRKADNDKFEIIAGERRWRAAQIAGLSKVPVIVRQINDKIALAIGLIENIQRESLTPLEEAKALVQLIEDFKMTHEEVSHVVGRSRSSVSNLIRLLQLSDDVKNLLTSGDLEMGHARALLPLDINIQFSVANKVIEKALSVRQTEILVKNTLNPKPKKTTKVDPYILELTNSLTKKLGSKTEIKSSGNNGKIIIHYKSKDEFDDIINHIS